MAQPATDPDAESVPVGVASRRVRQLRCASAVVPTALTTAAVAGGLALFELDAAPDNGTSRFTDFTYELLCRGVGGEILVDGLETGDAPAWVAAGFAARDRKGVWNE
jgi:hypothetical protein